MFTLQILACVQSLVNHIISYLRTGGLLGYPTPHEVVCLLWDTATPLATVSPTSPL